MLRNCKVARVLPKIADCAKNDRNAVLRARFDSAFVSLGIFFCMFFLNSIFHSLFYCRCCEYSLLILEYWADAPEIQRSADLYEDLIKCCVADAMSEVFVSDSFPFYNVHGQFMDSDMCLFGFGTHFIIIITLVHLNNDNFVVHGCILVVLVSLSCSSYSTLSAI